MTKKNQDKLIEACKLMVENNKALLLCHIEGGEDIVRIIEEEEG